jgi:hypothetical protein
MVRHLAVPMVDVHSLRCDSLAMSGFAPRKLVKVVRRQPGAEPTVTDAGIADTHALAKPLRLREGRC